MQLENLRNNSIGVFDSGLGGLSVLKEIKKLLPNESIIYFSDSLNCPYGSKSEEKIKFLSEKIVNFLVEKKKCKMIVIACNTITTLTIADFRKNFPIPFVGIEPCNKDGNKFIKN